MSTHPLADRPSLAPVPVVTTWQDVIRAPRPVTRGQYAARLTEWLDPEWVTSHASEVARLLWEHPDLLSLPVSTGAAYLSSAYGLARVDCEPVPAWLHYALPVSSPSL